MGEGKLPFLAVDAAIDVGARNMTREMISTWGLTCNVGWFEKLNVAEKSFLV